jgi:toxin ParE2
MKVRLLVPAAAELEEAVAWYRALAPALDQRLLAEVRAGCRLIAEHPHAWHPIESGVRRFRLRHFPYGLIYVIEAEEIIVLAVAHLHREPTYWRSRMSSR